jgi:hypothetical protein
MEEPFGVPLGSCLICCLLMSHQPLSSMGADPPLIFKGTSGTSQFGVRSMVFMRRVQEGAATAWMELGFVV